MLFGEGSNYSSTTMGYASWRPPPTTTNGQNDIVPNDSKLNKWTMPQRTTDGLNGYSRPPGFGDMSSQFWGDSNRDFHHSDSHIHGQSDSKPFAANPNNNNAFSGDGNVPVNWGIEVNQATPWDVGGHAPQNVNGAHQWNTMKWDGAKNDNQMHRDPMMSGGARTTNFYGGGNTNFPSQPRHPMYNGIDSNVPMQIGAPAASHYSQPTQLWMNGPNQTMDQFGRPNEAQRNYHQSHGNFSHPAMNYRNTPSIPPMPMMPPPPPMMMPSQNFRPMQPSHHVSAPPPMMMNAPPFPMPPFHQPQNNDDSMWQNPDASIKKWQRDTGTALWGDPEQPIQRWQQFAEEEELLAKASSPKPHVLRDLGWGDLTLPEDKVKQSANNGLDVWKQDENKEPENHVNIQRNAYEPSAMEAHHHSNDVKPFVPGTSDWDVAASVFPGSSMGSVSKQSGPKVSLADELSAMVLEDIGAPTGPIKPDVGSLW
ncbi:hypothetical protein Ddc_03260 [Ditylenchus destructor]|nr:hypothetical protein Ddc_03260 [Ditylenchus destructor]